MLFFDENVGAVAAIAADDTAAEVTAADVPTADVTTADVTATNVTVTVVAGPVTEASDPATVFLIVPSVGRCERP